MMSGVGLDVEATRDSQVKNEAEQSVQYLVEKAMLDAYLKSLLVFLNLISEDMS